MIRLVTKFNSLLSGSNGSELALEGLNLVTSRGHAHELRPADTHDAVSHCAHDASRQPRGASFS